MPFLLYQGDITLLEVDAVVNAANRDLKQGGGVCEAIFAKAGEHAMQQACDELAPVETGGAVITPGFDLPSRYVIHAVGPVWSGGKKQEKELLASCYRSALEIAVKKKLRSIAFPLISAGIYGYPKVEAYKVALSTILSFLERHDLTVYLVLFEEGFFKDAAFQIYTQGLEEKITEERVLLSHSRMEIQSCMTSPLETMLPEVEESFSQSLMRLIREKGLDEVSVYKGANIDRKHFSKIKGNEAYQPSKRTVIAFALSLKLDMRQTQALLERAGYCLSQSYLFDIIIEHFIEQKHYDIYAINEVLFSYGQSLLGA